VTTLDLFLVLGSVGTCFRTIITFVCYRHESSAYNTFCFIFVSLSFEARKFFWSSLLNLHIVFGIILLENRKMYTCPCTLGKYKHKFVENHKTALEYTKQTSKSRHKHSR
jgi:hypothetical protein